jgi:hypothetical protein
MSGTQSVLRTGANLVVKVAYTGSKVEKTIGYATAINYIVNNGLKIIHVVDTPFPQELAYGAAGMTVTGTLSLVLPKGTTLERAGLVPYRTAGGASEKDGITENYGSGDVVDTVYIGGGQYMHLRVYDRASGEMVMGCDYCKVQNYQISIQSKSVVHANISFVGKFLVPGIG